MTFLFVRSMYNRLMTFYSKMRPHVTLIFLVLFLCVSFWEVFTETTERFSTLAYCLSWNLVNFFQIVDNNDSKWDRSDLLEVKESYNLLDDKDKKSERIIYSLFAVRDYFLETQVRYLKRLLELDIITVVHIWDFCLTPLDRQVLELFQEDRRFEVKQLVDTAGNIVSVWTEDDWKKIYRTYFEYYNERLILNDTLIKADDDIVYIENLRNLLIWFKGAENVTLALPQIINSDFMAWLQLKRSMLPISPYDGITAKTKDIWDSLDVVTHVNILNRMEHVPHKREFSKDPLTNWYRCSSCARFAHEAFLRDRSKFDSNEIYLWSSPTRISLNFFVISGSTVKKYFGEGKQLSGQDIDETKLTWGIQKDYHTTNAIYMNTVVVHYSYETQFDVYPEFMEEYTRLSRNKIC